MVEALEAWRRHPGRYLEAATRPAGAPVLAVIGTGVDPAHPDFANTGGAGADVREGGQLVLAAARSFLGGGDPPGDGADDEHGHGTHLVGIAAAAANNGVTAGSGIAGLGYPAVVLPIKVAGATGVAAQADLARAIVYAADAGASVILIGFAGPTWTAALQEAVDYAWERGCLLVAPAGDAAGGPPQYPGACPRVLAVGAVRPDGALAGYSSWGDHVALVAPGGGDEVGVYSTLPTYPCTLRPDGLGPAYGWVSGSAQAAAHVAAAAALRLGQTEGAADARSLWRALQQSAEPTPGAALGRWSPASGWGRLAAARLLDGARAAEGWGGVVGRVLLAGRPAPGALVRAEPQAGGEPASAPAGHPAGSYRLPDLPAGFYRVVAEAEGRRGVWERVEVRPGCDAPAVDFWLGDPPAGAELVEARLPTAAVHGQLLEVSITYRNSGQSTWTRRAGYCLRPAEIEGPALVAPELVELPPGESVAPGGSWSFTFGLAAPEERGFYETAWRMEQAGGAGPIGPEVRARVSVTSFLDVPADHWALGAIEAVKAAGVVQGYGGDLYHPEGLVDRGQMAVFLARAMGGGDEGVPAPSGEPSFPDVPADHWAFRYVEHVHAQGIVQGYGDGYHPEGMVDRGQMAVFVARAMAGGDEGVPEPPPEPRFPDVPGDFWARRWIECLAGEGIVAGYPDGLYHPEELVSRDQMAVFVARAFGLPH